MRTLGFIAILAAVVLALESCGSRDSEQRAVVEEWMGKEIVIPENLTFQIQDTPINYDFNNADFKIVTYVDSTGCTNCKMKLKEWDKIVNDLKSDPEVDVNFLMVINSTDLKEIRKILKENNFQHPVCIDSLGVFNKVNTPPARMQFQTFLLNRQNEVIALGNPAYNPKIRELYKQLASEPAAESSDVNETSTICDNSVRALGVVNKGDTINKLFRLTNDKIDRLTLQEIVPSCHCITGNAEFTTIQRGMQADIKVRYIADTISQPIYQYLDVYFKEYDKPVRLILHGYINALTSKL